MKLVRDLMSQTLITLDRNDTLSIADNVMQADRIRHMPVLNDDGRLVGIVSQRDLFHSALVRALGFGSAAKTKMLDSIVVKEVMASEVVTTTPDTLLREAARVMTERKIVCLPVVDDDRLVGILTAGDFVAIAARSAS